MSPATYPTLEPRLRFNDPRAYLYASLYSIPCSDIVFDETTFSIICRDNALVLASEVPVEIFELLQPPNHKERKNKWGVIMKYLDRASQIIEMYLAGYPIREIMDATGVNSVSTIYAILHAAGVEFRRSSKPHKKIDYRMKKIVCTMHRNGASIYKIAKTLKRNPSTISYIIKRYCNDLD